MGAGIDPKLLRRKMYNRLKTVERQLQAKNIECHYMGQEVKGKHFSVYFASIGPASNGESVSYMVLRFNAEHQPTGSQKRAGDVDFSDWHTTGIQDRFDIGVEHVKQALSVENANMSLAGAGVVVERLGETGLFIHR